MKHTAEAARSLLHTRDTFQGPSGPVRLLFLLPESQWRPLRVEWWRGKEVSVIGGDEAGNYILRHCDGTVRRWVHTVQKDETLATSVHDFVTGLGPRP